MDKKNVVARPGLPAAIIVVAAIISLLHGACAPVPVDVPIGPAINAPCATTAQIPNAACGFGCQNSRLVCTGGRWDCIGPTLNERCVPTPEAAVPTDAVTAEAAVPASDASASTDAIADVPRADVQEPIVGTRCFAGIGNCQRVGTIVVDYDGGLPYCSAQPTRAGTEVCDFQRLDEDCDGMSNEGCECDNGRTRPCYGGPERTAGRGICRQGIQTCGADGRWQPACVGEVRPTTEICGNNLDDNCDGFTDRDCL